jgi:hypothetical protein
MSGRSSRSEPKAAAGARRDGAGRAIRSVATVHLESAATLFGNARGLDPHGGSSIGSDGNAFHWFVVWGKKEHNRFRFASCLYARAPPSDRLCLGAKPGADPLP